MTDAEVQTFTRLAHELQTPQSRHAAEEQLQRLRHDPNALQLSKNVLERSNDWQAQFQAALLMRDVALHSWDAFDISFRQSLREWCVCFALEQNTRMHKTVSSALHQATAVIWKRGWLSEGEDSRRAFLQQLHTWLNESEDRQIATMHLLHALVQEFGGLRASKMGVSFAYHRKVHAAFERTALVDICQMTTQTIKNLLPQCRQVFTNASQIDLAKHGGSQASFLPETLRNLLSITLQTLQACIEWDFKGLSMLDRTTQMKSSSDTKAQLVRLGMEWIHVVYDHELLSVLMELYISLRWMVGSYIPRACRSILCSLAGFQISQDSTDTSNALIQFGHAFLQSLLMFAQNKTIHQIAEQCSMNPIHLALIQSDTHSDLMAEGDDELNSFVSLVTLLAANLKTAHVARSGGEFLVKFLHELVLYMIEQVVAGKEACAILYARQNKCNLSNESITYRSSAPVQSVLELHEDYVDYTLSILEQRQQQLLSIIDTSIAFWVDVWSEIDTAIQQSQSSSETNAWLNDHQVQQLQQLLNDTASIIYRKLVDTHIHMGQLTVQSGQDDDDPFEDASALSEHLVAMAHLGRAHADNSCHLLSHQLLLCICQLKPLISGAVSDEMQIVILNETLWWLFSMASHLLTDEAKGETPSIPTQLNLASKQARRDHKPDPVLMLGGLVLFFLTFGTRMLCEVAEHSKSISEENKTILSPLVFSQLCSFTNRWIASYIAPDNNLYRSQTLSMNLSMYGTIHDSYGESSTVPPGQSIITQIQNACIKDGLTHNDIDLSFMMGGTNFCQRIAHAMLVLIGFQSAEQTLMEDAMNILTQLSKRARIWSPVANSPSWQIIERTIAATIAKEAEVIANSLRSIGSIDPSILNSVPSHSSIQLPSQEVVAQLQLGQVQRNVTLLSPQLQSDLTKLVIRSALHHTCTSSQQAAALIIQSLGAILRMYLDCATQLRTHAGQVAIQSHVTRALYLCIGTTLSDMKLEEPAVAQVIQHAAMFAAVVVDISNATGILTTLALRLQSNILDQYLQFAENVHAIPLYEATLTLLKTFARKQVGSNVTRQNQSKESSFNSMKQQTGIAAEEEISEHVGSLLELVGHVASKDDMDFAMTKKTNESNTSSDVVLLGMQVILPLMTEQLLQYPDICKSFLTLIRFVIENHPSKLAHLDVALFAAFMDSLQYGIKHYDTSIAFKSIEALNDLLAYHVDEIRKINNNTLHAAGINQQKQHNPNTLAQFIPILLQLAFLGGGSTILLSAIATAILRLSMCETEQMSRAIEVMISEHAHPSAKDTVRNTFGELGTAIQACQAGHTKDLRKFFTAFTDIVSKTQGLLVSH